MLRLNAARANGDETTWGDSNTTNVKVKHGLGDKDRNNAVNSNTTNVKVKLSL